MAERSVASRSRGRRFDVLIILAYAIVFYLLITAFFGYRVGTLIHSATTNPYAGIASRLVGQKATEDFVIQELRVPWFVTISPSFWLAMHLTE